MQKLFLDQKASALKC